MDTMKLHLLLADDDKDDRMFFKEALEELPYLTQLTEFNSGDQLMQWLNRRKDDLPDALFLDLNMPRKNGFQCLAEIKEDEKLKKLPVLIISTSYEKEIADSLYMNGAQFYIRKPTNFLQLKELLREAIIFITNSKIEQPSRETFFLNEDFKSQG